MISTKMTGEEFFSPQDEERIITLFEERCKSILSEPAFDSVPREDQKSQKQKETFANRLPKEPLIVHRHGAPSPLNKSKKNNKSSTKQKENHIIPFARWLPKEPGEPHEAPSPMNNDKSSTKQKEIHISPYAYKWQPKKPVIVERHGAPSQLEDAVYKLLRELMIFHECLRMRLDTHKNNDLQSRPFHIAEHLGFLLHEILLPYLQHTEILPYDYDVKRKFFPRAARGMMVIKADCHPLGSDAVDAPLAIASLRFSTSSEVNWTTPSHLVDLDPPVFTGTLEASRNGYVTKFCKYLPELTGYLTNMETEDAPISDRILV